MLLCLVIEKLAVNLSLPFGLSNIRSRGDEEVQGRAFSNGLCVGSCKLVSSYLVQ